MDAITRAIQRGRAILSEVEEMKNKEKYAKEILEIACSGDVLAISKVTGKPISCKNTSCEDCECYNAFLVCEEEYLKDWAESEYIEKPVISKRDKSFLDYLIEKYKFVARDENGELFVYKTQPEKLEEYWYLPHGRCISLNRHFNVDFPMVKWEDDKPWLIEDLKKLEVVEINE